MRYGSVLKALLEEATIDDFPGTRAEAQRKLEPRYLGDLRTLLDLVTLLRGDLRAIPCETVDCSEGSIYDVRHWEGCRVCKAIKRIRNTMDREDS